MKVSKHNIIWMILLCSTVVFGQKQSKKINESFKVNSNVLVEINTRHADLTVETWNKNEVSIKGEMTVEGMTQSEASDYFKKNFEALGNRDKVVIHSVPAGKYDAYHMVFDDMDFDFDFDFNFDSESISKLAEVQEADINKVLKNMPAMPPMPSFPAPVVEDMAELEFDYEAYQKDKETYMKEFEQRQKEWAKTFEENFEPQMKAYEEKMAQWEKEMAPQMKAYEKQWEQWAKDIAPQMHLREKEIEEKTLKMEEKLREMELDIQKKYTQKLDEKEVKLSQKYHLKKNLIIKVPKGAVLKVDAAYGKISLPDNIKIIQ
ncbi:MAG: hypothetical protein OEM04_01035 [Flavobacteriaceae bacterium]|nr:hypothetical protein [Flavobacteriaceae bacterium]